MNLPNKQTLVAITEPTPGFAIRILPHTELGHAMLIAQDEEDRYEPIGLASTISEGKEMGQEDNRRRVKLMDGNRDPGLCPCLYKLWARGCDGRLRVAVTWSPLDL